MNGFSTSDPSADARQNGARGPTHADPAAISPFAVADALLRRRALVLAVPLITAAVVVAAGLLLGDYTARSRFVPQSGAGELSRFAGIAAQFGIPMGANAAEQSPDFYVDLVGSGEVLGPALNQEYRFATRPGGADTLSGTYLSLLGIEGDTEEARRQNGLDVLRANVGASASVKSGLVTLKTTAPWAGLAEAVNAAILGRLESFDRERRQGGARAERVFVEERLAAVKQELESAESRLTAFLERNKRPESARLAIEVERLQRQVVMRQQVYGALAQAYEQARIEEVRNTPVITLVDRPEGSARGSRGLMVMTLLGLVLGTAVAAALVFALEWLERNARSPELARLRRTLRSMRRRPGERQPANASAEPASTAASVVTALVVALALVAPAAPVAAQRIAAEPYVSADHWSRHALQRLAGLGLIDAQAGLDAWPLRRDEVRALLERAAAPEPEPAREGVAAAPAVARDALAAFEAEQPRPGVAPAAASARLRTGWAGERGALRGGTSVRGAGGAWEYPGPVAVAAERGALGGASLDAAAGTFGVAASASFAGSASLEEAYGTVRLGALDMWAGRRSLGFGATRGGSAVLGPPHRADALGVRTAQAVRLPLLGSVRGALFVSRLARSGAVERPWFTAATLRFAPSRDVTIGLHRATLFGGADNPEPLSPRNLAWMLFGLTGQFGKDSGFENQVASVDAWARLDVGVPLVVYGEVGADDVGFTFWKTASLVAGAELPSLPFARALSVGIEHAHFPPSCCGHPPWYRHGDLGEGWTDEGRPLGHPLGGAGSEWTLDAGVLARTVQAEGRLSLRRRGDENLFAPARAGRSLGGSLELTIPVAAGVRLRGSGAGEAGDGWSAWSIRVGADWRVGPTPRAAAGPAHAAGARD